MAKTNLNCNYTAAASTHLYKWQTAGGLRDSSWILQFPLPLLWEAASFVTVSRSFSLEARSSWGWAGRGELRHPLGRGRGRCRRLLGGSAGWDSLGIPSPPTSLPHGGHLCHPTTFHPKQRSRTSGSVGLCQSRRGPFGPATGKPREAVCSAHLAGGLFLKG